MPAKIDNIENIAVTDLKKVYNECDIKYLPEENPFKIIFVDITHRCNMACKNCYIPNRELPDFPIEWLYEALAKLPNRTRIRLVGAEPTMREDLCEIISRVRKLGHTPTILTNGLKLARRDYVHQLKQAGLKTVYLSLNGGIKKELYKKIDDADCAKQKLKALENLLAEKMNITVGMVLIPGVNDTHLPEFVKYIQSKKIESVHLRSIGEMGRYVDNSTFNIEDMHNLLASALSLNADELKYKECSPTLRKYLVDGVYYQLTQWPDLQSQDRGRLTPKGYIEPMFESVIANGYNY